MSGNTPDPQMDPKARHGGEKTRTLAQNPPPEPPVRSQQERVERTGRAPEVTGRMDGEDKGAAND